MVYFVLVQIHTDVSRNCVDFTLCKKEAKIKEVFLGFIRGAEQTLKEVQGTLRVEHGTLRVVQVWLRGAGQAE